MGRPLQRPARWAQSPVFFKAVPGVEKRCPLRSSRYGPRGRKAKAFGLAWPGEAHPRAVSGAGWALNAEDSI